MQQQVKFTDVNPTRLPLFDRTIIFKIHAPKLYEGEAVALLGNHPTLGKWNPAHFLQMQNNHGKDWEISVNVQAIDAPIEYKYVVIDAQTQKITEPLVFRVMNRLVDRAFLRVNSASISRMFMCFMAVTSVSRGFRLMPSSISIPISSILTEP